MIFRVVGADINSYSVFRSASKTSARSSITGASATCTWSRAVNTPTTELDGKR